MGKHAAPRKPLFSRPAAQRATAVSLGTFVLCLGAAAPAFAVTTPTPPPVPKPLSDAVQQVSDTAGVPNPIAPDSTSTPKHHRSGKHSQKPQAPASHTRTTTPTSKPATHTVVPAYTPSLMTLASLHNPRATRTADLAGQAPSMAGTPTIQRIAPTAAHHSLINLPGTPAQQDTERILLVAAATLLLGGLASGHLRAAQRRMIAW